MSETGELFQEWKEEKQEKRWNNYRYSRTVLMESDLTVEEKANGHFIVHGNKAIFDFWATTGLFIERKSQKRGRGIRNLMKRAQG